MRREYMTGIKNIDLNKVLKDLEIHQATMNAMGVCANYSCVLIADDEYRTIAIFTDCPARDALIGKPLSEQVIPGTNGLIFSTDIIEINRNRNSVNAKHAPTIKTIADLEPGDIVTDGQGNYAEVAWVPGGTAKYYGNLEGEYLEDKLESGATVHRVSDIDEDYLADDDGDHKNTIRNINDCWGDPEEFESVEAMADCIISCGYELPEDGLKEGLDYEVIE